MHGYLTLNVYLLYSLIAAAPTLGIIGAWVHRRSRHQVGTVVLYAAFYTLVAVGIVFVALNERVFDATWVMLTAFAFVLSSLAIGASWLIVNSVIWPFVQRKAE